jgi:hypothetical protein
MLTHSSARRIQQPEDEPKNLRGIGARHSERNRLVGSDQRQDEEFCRKSKFAFPIGLDEAGTVLRICGVPGVPFSYVINNDGRVGYERSATEANCLRLGFTR